MAIKGVLPQQLTPTAQPVFIDDISSTQVEFISGFGFVPTLATATNGNDIWPGTATTIPIPAQPGGVQMQVVSTSANDGVGGTGALTLELHYLDHNGNDQSENITMNGTTPVTTVATDIRFPQFLHSLTVGSNGAAVGTITLSKAGAPATQYTLIQPGRNMSSNTARMIPAGKICLIKRFFAEGASNHFGDIHLRANTHEGILLPTGLFVTLDEIMAYNNAASHDLDPPFWIPSLAIVKCTGFTTDANGNFAASWYGILIDTPT